MADVNSKKSFDLSDIMSILGDEEPKQEQPKPKPEVKVTPKVEPKPVPKPEPKAEPKVEIVRLPEKAAAQDLSSLMASIEQKNNAILKLNSDIIALQYEIKSKDAKIAELTAKMEELSKRPEPQPQQATVSPVIAVEPYQKPKEPQYNIKNDAPVEEDVASIFKRIARAREQEEAPAEGENIPRKLRTAKLYDL